MALMPTSGGAPATGTGSSSGLTPNEAKIIQGFDYNNAWRHLEYLSSLGEKAAGTPQEALAQAYVYDELSKMPMDALWRQTFPVEQWIHYGTTLKVVSNGNEDIPTTTIGSGPSVWGRMYNKPYYFGNANDGKTLVADLVDVGLGTAAAYDTLGNVAGMIALVHRNDDIQCWPDTATREAELHGISAVMFYGYYTGNDLPEGIKQDSSFSPIPAIAIAPVSAWHLQDLLSAGRYPFREVLRIDQCRCGDVGDH